MHPHDECRRVLGVRRYWYARGLRRCRRPLVLVVATLLESKATNDGVAMDAAVATAEASLPVVGDVMTRRGRTDRPTGRLVGWLVGRGHLRPFVRPFLSFRSVPFRPCLERVGQLSRNEDAAPARRRFAPRPASQTHGVRSRAVFSGCPRRNLPRTPCLTVGGWMK